MKNSVILLLFFSLCFSSASAPAAESDKNPVCLLKTSMGDIRIELFAVQAPETVRNFIDLAEGRKPFVDVRTGKEVKRPFYDNLTFHRVIKNFMIQGGCPKGDGSGDPGYRFADEINAVALGLDKIKVLQPDGTPHPYLGVRDSRDFSRMVVMPLARRLGITSQQQFDAQIAEIKAKIAEMSLKECYENLGYRYTDKLQSSPPVRGVIAMANSGPNTNGSQFFIDLVDTPWLTGRHTVFGRVIQGMEAVDRIGAVPVDSNSRPESPVTILSVRMER